MCIFWSDAALEQFLAVFVSMGPFVDDGSRIIKTMAWQPVKDANE